MTDCLVASVELFAQERLLKGWFGSLEAEGLFKIVVFDALRWSEGG